jgi:hypothetical protein
MRALLIRLGVSALVVLAFAPPAFAQGGGASQTGTIAGRVTDTSGAVLPGVTVNLASPSLIGVQTTTSNENGMYRFPAVPPGVYVVTYELTGFSTLRREGIDVPLGFTATLNVALPVASLQESVTVTGESPVIDTSATRVQQNFKLDQLESIPNARDMWSLLAVTPSVQMTRIDVGGNRAGTQTGFTAFGFGNADQQVRVLVEGINTTEGTGGAGFYFDFGSFEEAFFGTAAQGAEMPHPGVQTQFLGKSGGSRFSGQVYTDYENNAMQGDNITPEQIARGVREGSNEVEVVRDANVHVGGPLLKDRLWAFGSWREQFNAVRLVAFKFDQTFDTTLWNLSGKLTYQATQNNKFVAYYQWGQKVQPYRQGLGGFDYLSVDDTLKQDSGSWVWKGEWNGTVSNNLYVESRFGQFGYYFPLIGYSNEPFRRDGGTRVVTGGDRIWQQDRQRWQATGAATYYKDGFLGGNHSLKLGGEVNLEDQWNGWQRIAADNVQHFFQNGRSLQVVIGFPTADGDIGSYGARQHLLANAKLDHHNAFLNDQWSLGRITLNLGVRYDYYKSHVPEQRQVASTTAGFSVPATTFAPETFFTWHSVAPRAGIIYNLDGNGRTVAKVNYGYFGHNPGPGAAANGNPNQSFKTLTYTWNDLNADRLFQFGEHGTLVSDLTGPGGVRVDPAITQPYTHELAAFLERQLTDDVGLRSGFVYKTIDNQTIVYQPGRPISAYTTPFTVTDIGLDGVSGTGDDRPLTFLGIPTSQLGPATQVFMNVPAIGRFRTVELSMTKRPRQRWSMQAGASYTWTKEHGGAGAFTYLGNNVAPSIYPNSPNDTSLNSFTSWSFKASGSYEAPWGIRVSPVLRHQAGQNYGRTITFTAPAGVFCCGLNTNTVLVEPMDARRSDNITVIDLRAEKAVPIARTRLRLFLDLFNITNSHAAETISFSTGTAFERPSAVLAPRVARVGARFEW